VIPLSENAFASAIIAALMVPTAAYGAFGTGAVQLQRHACIPLLVRHFEHVDLRHSARNIEQRVDTPELGERLFY
jgi:hypothetical protein